MARLGLLGGLLCIDIAAFALTLVAAVVVPSTLSTIVVVPQDECVHRCGIALGILYRGHTVQLLADGSLDYLVLFILMQLGSMVKVQLVVIEVRHSNLGFLHVHTDGQNPLQREIWILDVTPVYLLILVEQVGVLELFDGLLSDFRDPIVQSETTIFQDHLLEILEFVSLIVVSFQVFEELSNMFLLIHDLRWICQIDRFNHHPGN